MDSMGNHLHYFDCRKFFAFNLSKVKLFSKSRLLLAAAHDLEKAGKKFAKAVTTVKSRYNREIFKNKCFSIVN
jgi:hypothetical protein